MVAAAKLKYPREIPRDRETLAKSTGRHRAGFTLSGMRTAAPTLTVETLDRQSPVIAARLYPTQYAGLQALTASSGESTSGLMRRLVTEEIQRHKISEEVTAGT